MITASKVPGGQQPGSQAYHETGRILAKYRRKVASEVKGEERAYDAGATKRTAPLLAPWLTGDREALKALPKRPPGKS